MEQRDGLVSVVGYLQSSDSLTLIVQETRHKSLDMSDVIEDVR
jgi:hypothetical protein